MSRRLLVATGNQKKLKELEDFLKDLKLELTCLSDFPDIKTVEENGSTFQENAVIKALSYAKQTGLLTLAEDSGLSCDALEGAPGVYSARFAGEPCNDGANNEKLLRMLQKVPDNCRGAHYTSAVAIALPGKMIGVVEGEVHGIISKELRGNGGFGYDPLFFYPAYQKTFGEVETEFKYKVSHRTKALEKAKFVLEQYFRSHS